MAYGACPHGHAPEARSDGGATGPTRRRQPRRRARRATRRGPGRAGGARRARRCGPCRARRRARCDDDHETGARPGPATPGLRAGPGLRARRRPAVVAGATMAVAAASANSRRARVTETAVLRHEPRPWLSRSPAWMRARGKPRMPGAPVGGRTQGRTAEGARVRSELRAPVPQARGVGDVWPMIFGVKRRVFFGVEGGGVITRAPSSDAHPGHSRRRIDARSLCSGFAWRYGERNSTPSQHDGPRCIESELVQCGDSDRDNSRVEARSGEITVFGGCG